MLKLTRLDNYYFRNKEKVTAKNKAWAEANPAARLIHTARSNARRKGIEFSITLKDVVFPEFCPVLGMKLEFGDKRMSDNSPSLDRSNPKLGYIPGNVKVISWRANRLKCDCVSGDELRAVANYVDKLPLWIVVCPKIVAHIGHA